MVREFIAEFRGLSSTAKQKKVLDEIGLARQPLSVFVNGDDLNAEMVSRLLMAMKRYSKPVIPKALGIIGEDHAFACCKAIGCEMESFGYAKQEGETDGLPWAVETAFAT